MRTALVGRDREAARFRAALGDPEAEALVLTGAAGVGKTRLARECAASAEPRGYATAWVAATDAAASVPLGAFAPLLPAPRAGADRFELLHAAAHHLAERARRRRLVLVVDDADRLDEASSALLGQLAAADELFVLATVRTGEQWPEALASLWTAGRAECVVVGPLSRQETERLGAETLGGPLGQATLEELWRLSEGTPLVVREVLSAAREAGVLREEEGVWRHRGRLAVPAGLATVVDAGLGGLDEAETSVLEHLVVGEPLGLWLLGDLTDLDAVGRLERRGLVATRPDGTRQAVSLAHPVHREVLAARLPGARRAAIARGLADAVAGLGARRRDDVLRLGTWRLDGGGAADATLFLAAARQAASGFDHPLTERLARAAREAGGGGAAQLVLGRALAGQGRIAEADEALAAAGAGAGGDRDRSRAARAYAEVHAAATGDYAGALQALGQARERVTEPGALDELAAAEVAVHAHAGDAPRCLAVADAVLARPGVTDRVRLSTLAASVGTRAMAGDVARALRDADEGLALLARHAAPAPLARAMVGTGRGLALLGLGRLDEAEAGCRAGYDAAVGGGVDEATGAWAVGLGAVLLERPRPVQARAVLAEGVAALADADPLGLQPAAFALAATAAAMVGDVRGARRWLAELHADPAPGAGRFAGWTARARAWAAAADDDLAAVCAALSDDGGARRTTLPLVDVPGLVDLARFGRADLAAAGLAGVASRVDSAYVATLAAYARHAAGGDAAGLEYLSGQLAGFGADLVAAEAAVLAADLFARQGARRRSEQLAALARQRAADCEGVRSPALATLPADLTPREREVALLAAQRATSHEIARRLSVSRRTVDNHLAAVYAKLAINRRSELPRALGLADEDGFERLADA